MVMSLLTNLIGRREEQAMIDSRISHPSFLILMICALLILVGTSCKTVTLSPKFQHFGADVEFEGAFLGVPTGTYEGEFDYAALGLEFAWQASPYLELFADLGFAAADEENLDVGTTGSELGIGIRSPDPTEPGWGMEWAVRVHSHNLESEETIAGVRYDAEFIGGGSDLNLGVRRAFDFERGLLVVASAGVWAKSLNGEWTADLVGVEMLDIDYEFESEALYAGIALTSTEEQGVDLSACYYQGAEDLRGVIVTAGFKF